MKWFLIIFSIPIFIFCQETILIGDVDCNGEVNSEDAALILSFVTNVTDSLPCQENMNGLTIDQLEELVDMMSEQVTGPEEMIEMIGPMYIYDDYVDLIEVDYVYGAECCNELYYFEALLFCSKLEYDGYDDWRLPSLTAIENWISLNDITTLPITNFPGTGGEFFLNNSKAPYSAEVSYIFINNLSNILYFHYTTTIPRRKCFCVR